MAGIVETSVDDYHVGLLRLNHPETRNSLSLEMREGPRRAERFDADPEVRCIVVAGSDKIFASGADIRALAARGLGEPSDPAARVLAPASGGADAAGRRRLRLRPRRRLRAGAGLRHDRRRREGPLRPAGDHPRDHPRRRRHPAPGAGARQAAGDGVRAHRPPLRRRRRRARWGSSTRSSKKGDWLERGDGAGADDRRAAADRRPAGQAGRARRRGDLASPPGSRTSGGSTSWRWRPRTGSRACRPSSRSASRSSRGGERCDAGGSGSSAPARWARGIAQLAASAATRRASRTRRGARRRGASGSRGARQRGPAEGCGAPRRPRPPAAGSARPEHRRAGRLRPGDRGGPRGPRAEAGAVRGLAEACGPETILASNTSSLRIADIAAGVPPPRAGRRHALLQPAGADGAGRGGRHRRLLGEALTATTEVGRRMGRTPIRAKDSPGFIANRLARPFSLESLRMLGDGVADARDDRPRLPPRRRLPHGPVRADRPDRPRRQPQRRPLLLRPGRRAGALAPEPDPGTDGRRRPARSQERPRLLQLRRRRPHREPDPDLGIEAPDPRPRRAGEDRPGRAGDPPSPRRPDRQRGRLRARRGGRLTRRHGHGDAARLQLAARPARADRADRRRARRGAARRAARAEHGDGLPARAPRAARRRRATRPADDGGDFEEARRGLVAPFDPPRVETQTAARSGSWSPTGSSTRSRRRHRQPEPLAPVASSTGSPGSSSSRRASTNCAASTSPTCTWSRATRGSS